MKLNFGIGEEWRNLKTFQKLSDEDRSIVFYAENKASLNHFRTLMTELTEVKGLKICYVTSVKNDKILSNNNEKILTYFIGDGVALSLIDI